MAGVRGQGMVGDTEGRSLRSRDFIRELVGGQVFQRRVVHTHLQFGKIILGAVWRMDQQQG